MPLIYFYKERNNTIGWNKFSSRKYFSSHHHWLCIFKVLFIVDSSVGLLRRCHVTHMVVNIAETHYPLRNCAHIQCLVSENIQHSAISSTSTWRNSLLHFYSAHAHLRCYFDWLLFVTGKTRNYEIVAGRFSFYCHASKIHLTLRTKRVK